MSRPLRVLIVEDVEEDAELIASRLRRSGVDADCTRVDTADGVVSALSRSEWDVILTDYTMPALSVPQVLTILQERRVAAPCVLVSGTASDESARAAMRLGMTDFVSKNNLDELGPVIARILDGHISGVGGPTGPRIRLSSGLELHVVEWSDDRRMLDGRTPLPPGHVREGLLLEARDATRVRLRVIGCEVQAVLPHVIIYRSLVALA